ncbi:MAG: nitrilase-related carbon-nitrogen hydrolase [Phycisphaerales bacterium]|nr:nitrilase-related carbon-nitrogen hydrolase [Phycisphaerales bacterium]
MSTECPLYTATMRVMGLQYDICWEDKAGSQSLMDGLLEASPPAAGSLLVTPELGDVGFSRNLERIIDVDSQTWAIRTARHHQCWVQHGWAERSSAGRAWNTMTTVSPSGEIVDQYRKIVPFTPGHEDRAYDPGEEIHIVEINGILTCPFLCYDLRFPELWRIAAKAGAELFTIGASWPAVRANHWKMLNISRAMENQAWVLGVNRTGKDPYLGYSGDSLLISPLGEIVSEAQAAPVVLSGEVDPESSRRLRKEFATLDDIRPGFLGDIEVVRR